MTHRSMKTFFFEILTNHVRSFIMQTDFLEFYERIWLNYHKNQQRYFSGADIVSFFKKLLKFVFLQSVTNKTTENCTFLRRYNFPMLESNEEMF